MVNAKKQGVVNIKIKIVYCFLIVIYLISLVFNIYIYEFKYSNDSKDNEYKVMVVDKQKEYDDKVTYLVKLNKDKFLLNIYFKNKYDNKKNFSENKVNEVKKYNYGDCIKINGKIIIPEKLGNIGEFDYKRYLNSKGIVAGINAYNVDYVNNIGSKFIKSMYKLKESIASKIDNNLEEKQAELLKGMMYGDTRNLDEGIKEDFQNIGISHITAVSGSNLTIFLMIFTIILSKAKLNRYVYAFLQFLIIAIFCVISDLEVSVLRASIMMIIGIVCRIRNAKISLEKSLILTLVIMLFTNPYRIFNIGMIFSFLSTISIVIFYPKIYNFLESKICWNIKKEIVKKLLLKISAIISITLAANILILPISINSFNKFSTIFVISNLFISSLSTFINILGIILLLLPNIPIICNLMWYVLNLCLKLLINISVFFNNMSLTINVRDIPFLIMLIYYLYIVLIYIGYKLRDNKKTLKQKLIQINNSVICLFIISICFWVIYIKTFDNYVYYFNVGQGEMAIVKKHTSVIMIDSGSITNDTPYIFEAFSKKEGINKIDILIISHFHSDLVNGIKEIIEKYKVEYIMYAYPYDLDNEQYLEFLKYIDKTNVKKLIVKSGDEIILDKMRISVLFPDNKYICVGSEIDENENGNSLVVNITMNDSNYLFLGDSIKESEKYILQNMSKLKISKIKNIKIAHHGSKTSTSEEFVKMLMPRFAVISAKKKVYNHPSKEVVELLKRYNITTHVTEKQGGIKFLEI